MFGTKLKMKRWAPCLKIKNFKMVTISAGKCVETKEPSYTVGGNAN